MWTSAAALIAVAAAWFTYAAAEGASRKQVYEALESIVTGLERELELIRLWAGSEDTPGYSKEKPPNQYRLEAPDWQLPSRVIFTFDYPTVKNLTQSRYVNLLRPILDDFI